MSLPREFWTDARHYQIVALSTLLVFNLVFLDFGAQPLNIAHSGPKVMRSLPVYATATRRRGQGCVLLPDGGGQHPCRQGPHEPRVG